MASNKSAQCTKCGTVNPQASNFCAHCGNPLNAQAAKRLEKGHANIDNIIKKGAKTDAEFLAFLGVHSKTDEDFRALLGVKSKTDKDYLALLGKLKGR